jgi:hypothetical protein
MQNARVDRFIKEVDGAVFIAAKQTMRIAIAGGHEDQRYMLGALAAAHDFGEFETIHLRHLHVENNQRHIVL